MQNTAEEYLSDCQGLSRLKLSADEIEELKSQGFVAEERRGKTVYFKLRFRLQGRQRVKYLGRDVAFVNMIRQELAVIQTPRRTLQHVERCGQHARTSLRQMKSELTPMLASYGYHFHGMAIRKTRRVQES